MKTNTLFTSTEVVAIAVGETYTLRADEVMVNNVIYRKSDIEISLQNNDAGSAVEDVNIGINKRDGVRNLPSDKLPFTKWIIDGTAQITGLTETVEAIQAGIREV